MSTSVFPIRCHGFFYPKRGKCSEKRRPAEHRARARTRENKDATMLVVVGETVKG